MTYPASVGTRYKVKYGYQFGDVASVREFTGDVDGTVLWSLTTLDPLGNPIDETYGNGLRVVSGFNPLTGLLEYRQAGVGGSSNNRQSLTFGWDKTNNLTQRQDLFQQPTVTENVYYDALNRLDYSTLNGSQNLDVTLDLIGNITARSDVGSYTYHATKKHAVIAAGGTSYGYDPNGNLTSRSNASGSTAVTWTSYNYPSSIVFTPAGGAPTNVALNKPTTGSGTPCVASEGPEKAVNGSVSGGNSDKWCSLQTTKWMQVDLQSSQAITQFVVKHAETGGEFGVWNTRDFTIQVSADGVTWSTAVTVSGNTAGTTTHPVSVTARYARLNVLTPTSDGNPAARIYEFEVWAGSSGTSLSSQFLYTPDRQYFRQTAAYSNGASTTEYVGGVMEIVTEDGTTHYRHMVPAGNGLVIHTRTSSGSNTRYLTRDHLGSISLITDAGGVAEMTQSFAAYGARRQADWQAGVPDWKAIASSTRRGYTGHTMLDNLNLVHMNGRVYDPAVGRFMSADPVADGLGEPGGFNRYSYVLNMALSQIDPTGTQRVWSDWRDGPGGEWRGIDARAFLESVQAQQRWEQRERKRNTYENLYRNDQCIMPYCFTQPVTPPSPPPDAPTPIKPPPRPDRGVVAPDGPVSMRPNSQTYAIDWTVTRADVHNTAADALRVVGGLLIAFDVVNTFSGVLAGPDTSLLAPPVFLAATRFENAARAIPRAKAFEKAGIETTDHFRGRLAQRANRGITERSAMDAYRNGRLYYDDATGNYVRHSSRTGVSVVTDAPTGGRAITVFEGNPSPSWNPVPWRPGQ